jgi:pimeloyl-ACP methyl ester carboxylesterase
MNGIAAAALVAVMALAMLAPPVTGQSDTSGYCEPGNVQYDTRDTERDTPAVPLPPGFTRRPASFGGRYRTPLIEAGSPKSREAIVFIHGNPGSALDFAGILRAAPPGARVLAADLMGFGEAEKPWDAAYSLDEAMPIMSAGLRQFGVDRVHLVGHDIGGAVGAEWVSRNPRYLASATFLNSGVLLGYTDHDYARIWKQPGQGEAFMAATTRPLFHNGINSREPEPLPAEFIDRNYDYFDRPTRCAILKAYRSVPDVNAVAEQQAKRLRPHDRPALVIWGEQDSFIAPEVAARQREAFPHARIEMFPESGHWPFVNEENRTVRLMRGFFERHVLERAGARIRASVKPRRVVAGRRVRLRVRAWLRGRPRRPLANATVRVTGRKAVTGRRGRASVVVRPPQARRVRVRVTKKPLRPARRRVAIREL